MGTKMTLQALVALLPITLHLSGRVKRTLAVLTQSKLHFMREFLGLRRCAPELGYTGG